MIAGHETTVGLISNELVFLDEHPESLQERIAYPEFLSSAIEEVLRYRGPVHSLVRVAMVDTVLAGEQIKAGDLVLPLFAAANLDERRFPMRILLISDAPPIVIWGSVMAFISAWGLRCHVWKHVSHWECCSNASRLFDAGAAYHLNSNQATSFMGSNMFTWNGRRKQMKRREV